MESYYAEIVGVAAAAASLYAAHAKTIIPLRIAAVIANLLAMGYSLLHGTYPTFVLNALLLPLNAWRLHQMIDLVRGIDAAIASDMNVDWLLKYMRPKHYRAGDVMMARGEYATEAFYVVAGEVEIVEIKQSRGAGHAARRDRIVHAQRPPHHDGALQDRRRGRHHRLRPDQGIVFPESAVRIPPAASHRRAAAEQCRTGAGGRFAEGMIGMGDWQTRKPSAAKRPAFSTAC